jgi:hypothetical protein
MPKSLGYSLKELKNTYKLKGGKSNSSDEK